MDQLLYVIPRGIAIGALVSAPMGPIGMLVIQRTLSKGRWPAFFTGIGAAFSDLVYCLLCGFCLSFVTGFIDRHELLIQIVGSVVLIGFSIFLFRKNPTRSLVAREQGPAPTNYWTDILSGFALTFSNPLILFFIIGLFARFNFLQPEYKFHHYLAAYLFIFCGATLWWYMITFLVGRFKGRFNVRSLRLINRIVAFILLIMAIAGIAMAFYEKVCP